MRSLLDIGIALESELDSVVRAGVERCGRELDGLDLGERPRLLTAITDAYRAETTRYLIQLTGGRARPTELSPAAWRCIGLARSEAIAGEDVAGLFRLLRPVWSESAAEVMTAGAGAGREPDPGLLRLLHSYPLVYTNALVRLIPGGAPRSGNLGSRPGEGLRLAAVREILAGGEVEADRIDHDLSLRHLGFTCWGPEAPRLARGLGAATGCRVFSVRAGDEMLWGWLGSVRGFDASLLDAVAATDLPAGHGLAFGEPHPGVEGFRRSHREALLAERIARLAPDRPIGFGKAAYEALALRDPDAARAFVDGELGPLLDGSSRSESLLETLSAYLDSSLIALSAAARLGVDDRTVKHRLEAIEEALGCDVRSRRTELQSALRLRRRFSSEAATDPVG